jgi:hypothetical protein
MNRLNHFILIGSLVAAFGANAQNVGINTTGAVPNASAGLDVDFSNKGMLIPRVALTGTSSNAPIGASITTSLLVYNTATTGDVTPGYYYWGGSNWMRFAADGSAWRTTGNAGTNTTSNFIGTTDNVGLMVRTNNSNRFEFTSNGRLRAFVDGTAGLPAYSWNGTSGETMGLYRIGANILGFSTNGTERMRILANGNIGMNTIPNANNNTLSTLQNTTTGTAGWFSTSANSNWVTLEANATSTTQGVGVSGQGFVGVQGTWTSTAGWAGYFIGDVNSTTGYYLISDIRYKKNIALLNSENSMLYKLMQLKPVQYNWKTDEFPGLRIDSSRLSYGFIAQEVFEVIPEIVKTDKKVVNPKILREPNSPVEFEEGYYSVNYIELIPILTAAMQEQQLIINQQNERITLLEEQLEKIIEVLNEK